MMSEGGCKSCPRHEENLSSQGVFGKLVAQGQAGSKGRSWLVGESFSGKR